LEFDESYQQEMLLKLTRKAFIEEVASLLRPDFFDPGLEPVAEEILKRYRKTKRCLTKAQFRQLCRQHDVKLNGSLGGDTEFDRDQVLLFARNRAFRDASSRAWIQAERGNISKAYDIMDESRRTMPGRTAEAPDILTVHTPLPGRRNLVPTGIPNLDECLKGGIAGGDLAVVLAPTSGGKTSFLVSVACAALKMGRRVDYATLEVPRYEIDRKVRSCLTEMENPSKKKWTEVSRKLHRKGAAIHVWEHPPRSISADELAGQVAGNAEVILVDYGDYLMPPSGRGEGVEYQDLGNIYGSMKRIALERRIPLWTASQVNRSAYDRGRLHVEDVEASLRKMMLADQVISINQDEEERRMDDEGHTLATLRVAKNRHGPRFVDVRVRVNWACCLFDQEW